MKLPKDYMDELIKQNNIISKKANFNFISDNNLRQTDIDVIGDKLHNTKRNKRCAKEIDKLADWITENIPEEIGRCGSESVADVAIRLLDNYINVRLKETKKEA